MQRGCKWRSGMQGVAVLVKGGTIRRRRALRERGRDYLQWDRRCIKLTPTQHSNLHFCLHPILHTFCLHLHHIPYTFHLNLEPMHLNLHLCIHSIHLTIRLCLHLIQSNCYLWGFQTDVILEFDPPEAKFSWYFNRHNPFRAGSSLTAENVMVLIKWHKNEPSFA